ncbi:hypothetical protein HPB49_013935 [Dermacentor silvarum]|uniref:Uncharacterized protein n=1 Tax=Dermacentor silvarum TaxID=543639 RepID=A0ACB8C9M3_DERSI|nr:hypothetical protein HPB49_013935 [Dermacentor silvarum]
MTSNLNLHFLQTNLDHSTLATECLVELVRERQLSFAIACDPYIRNNTVPGIPNNFYKFLAPENPRVVIFGTGAGCDCFPLMTGSYVVAIRVTAPSLDFVLIAAYAPPHAAIEPILDLISDCFGRCDGAMVVVAGDLNAKHSNWGGGITDARGAAVMQLACQCDLHVLNDPTSDPTFETAYAESWIDVTLASSAMISRGHEWAVLEDLTLSDHRLVEFSFPFARPPPRKKLTFQGKADLLRQLAGEPWFGAVTRAPLRSGAALDAVLEKFYSIYARAHARHLRNTKGGPHRANAWWTPELGSERGRVRAMRRKYQRARDPDMRAQLRDLFAAARSQYRAHIRDAQESALKRYCTECTKKTIFGAPFKAAFEKARPPVVLPALRAPDGRLTSDALSSASLLLRTQVSLDDLSTDNAEHATIRAVAAAPAVTFMDDRPFTTEEDLAPVGAVGA